MPHPTKHFYEFDRFRIDLTERLLLSDGEVVPLTQKAFEVLLALVERNEQIVSKEELMRKVWPDSFVEEGNLTQNIYTLRKVLGQTTDGEAYIQTVPRRGYRFSAPVSESRNGGEEADAPGSAVEPEARVAESVTASRAADSGWVGRNSIGRVRKYRRVALGLMALLSLTAVSTALYLFAGWSWFKTGRRDSSRTMTVTALTTAGNVTCAAISPDGNYVAYATNDKPHLSSLWIEQPATSTRRTIIPPSEVRYHAVTFSPDGRHVYYIALTEALPVRTLYRVSVLGGPTKKLIDDAQTAISFSPDGTRFAFRRTRDTLRQSALFVANADGSGEREVAAIRYPESLNDPAWSPDGKVIACAAGNLNGVASMYVVGVNTEDWTLKTISARRWQWVGQTVWLADSSGLVMVARDNSAAPGQIWRLSYPDGEAVKMTNDSNYYNRLSSSADSSVLAASQVKQVTNVWIIPANDPSRAKQITFGAGGYRGALSWTPDGKIVCDTEAGNATAISMMDADGSNPKQLTGDLTGRASMGRSTVSPDGRHIFFTSDLTGARHIWRMNIDGSDPVQLTNGGGEDDPHCSPDGRWIYYTNLERHDTDRPTLGRVAIDGGEPEQLTEDFTAYPVVSPDGKVFAALYADGPGLSPWKLAIYPLAGGRPLKIFPQPVSGQSILWTTDGLGLTYLENPNAGASKIWVQPVNGGQPKKLAEFETDRVFGLDWSRDGKSLACVRGLWATNIVLIKDFK